MVSPDIGISIVQLWVTNFAENYRLVAGFKSMSMFHQDIHPTPLHRRDIVPCFPPEPWKLSRGEEVIHHLPCLVHKLTVQRLTLGMAWLRSWEGLEYLE